MSIHQKMQSDYLWVRNAPVEEGLKVRNHGFYFMYDRAPNSVQRLQMVYRSIGKQYDWELEKFRLGKKGVDRGNKRRGFKNFFRFVKNPISYTFWKIDRFFPTIPKLIPIMFVFTWIMAFWEMKKYSNANKNLDQMLLRYGKNIQGSQGRMKGFHKQKQMRSPNFFDALFRAPLTGDQIVLNPTWKQNIRKQLQLTNSYGVAF